MLHHVLRTVKREHPSQQHASVLSHFCGKSRQFFNKVKTLGSSLLSTRNFFIARERILQKEFNLTLQDIRYMSESAWDMRTCSEFLTLIHSHTHPALRQRSG